jgi:GNAT superfamily N-acetyltransferase
MKWNLPEQKQLIASIVCKTREFSAAVLPNDLRDLAVFIRDENGEILGSITAQTYYWNYLEIAFLWVHEEHRSQGIASRLLADAEQEAVARGCTRSQLDTFNFQTLGFYLKAGYKEFGSIQGFGGTHQCHYLHKTIGNTAALDR